MIALLVEKKNTKATLVGCFHSTERVYKNVVPSKHVVEVYLWAIKIAYVLKSVVGFSMTTSDIPTDYFFSSLKIPKYMFDLQQLFMGE